MKEFKYIDYHTEYSCTGAIKKEMKREYCFNTIFHNVTDNDNIEYCIILYKGLDFISSEKRSNACLLDLLSLKNHLRKLRFFYPISYHIKEKKYNDRDIFEINLKLKDVPAIFHKFALTWIRYAYEFPYNVWIIDAYKLQKYYRYDSIFNLFHIIGICNDIERDIHQIVSDFPFKSVNKTELKDVIDKSSGRLQSMFQYYKKQKRFSVPTTIGEYSSTDSEYWKDGFDERKPVYMKMYRLIKKL